MRYPGTCILKAKQVPWYMYIKSKTAKKLTKENKQANKLKKRKEK